MKVTLIAAISVDGFIAQSTNQSSLNWTSKEDTQFFMEKTKEIGAVIVGRTTFETFKKPLPGRRNIVLTSTPESFSVEGAEFTSEQPAELLKRLEGEGVQNIAVIGGSRVYSDFIKARLVSELFLTIEPVVFGSGVRLLEETGRLDMKLEEVRALNASSLLLHYLV